MKSFFSPIIGLLTISAMVVVVGCQRVELTDMPVVGDETVNVAPTILSAQTAPQNAITRAAEVASASKSAFVDGDRFSMYITRAIDTLALAANVMRGVDYSNIAYVRTAGTFAAASGPVYYPYRAVNNDLWGIYPYDAALKFKNAASYLWTVQVDQSTVNSVLNSDFLVARTKDITPSVNTKVDMQFEHKMTRVRLVIQVPSEVDGKKLNSLKPIENIYIEGMRTSGAYNFNANSVAINVDQAVTSIVPLARGSESVNPADPDQGQLFYYEAIVVPQTLKAGALFLRLVVNYVVGSPSTQGLFLLELPADFTLLVGKQHSYNVAFDNKQRLRLDGTKILDWDEVSNVDADVEESETVKIGDVEWARGNLVANGKNGAKIGKPSDGGLYFQFGSLVGYAGGSDGSGMGTCTKTATQFWSGPSFVYDQDVRVTPSSYAPLHQNWPVYANISANTGFGYFYFSDLATDNADFKLDSRWTNPMLGIGDPCEYYLGKPWRLPSSTEMAVATGMATNNYVAWGTPALTASKTVGPNAAVGAWFGVSAIDRPQVTTDLFIPASGRRTETGAFNGVGDTGMIIGKSVASNANSAYSMWSNQTSGVWPRYNLANTRQAAYPVRCVK